MTKPKSPIKEISNNQPTSKPRPHHKKVRPSAPHYEIYDSPQFMRDCTNAILSIYSFAFVRSENRNLWHMYHDINQISCHFLLALKRCLATCPVREHTYTALVFIVFHLPVRRMNKMSIFTMG
nr:unnamed protein product [uncultured archaeon]